MFIKVKITDQKGVSYINYLSYKHRYILQNMHIFKEKINNTDFLDSNCKKILENVFHDLYSLCFQNNCTLLN